MRVATGPSQLYHRLILPALGLPSLQVRSPTNARCAAKRSVRAPTSLPTAESTRVSSPSVATCVGRASRGRWISGGTGRRSMDSNEHRGRLRQQLRNTTVEDCLPPGPAQTLRPVSKAHYGFPPSPSFPKLLETELPLQRSAQSGSHNHRIV